MAAKKSTPEVKTVTRYGPHGTKVTVSEETAKRLGAAFITTKPQAPAKG